MTKKICLINLIIFFYASNNVFDGIIESPMFKSEKKRKKKSEKYTQNATLSRRFQIKSSHFVHAAIIKITYLQQRMDSFTIIFPHISTIIGILYTKRGKV